MRAMVAALAVATGCGFGWVDGASSTDGLPTAGIGPYARPEADDLTPAREPWLLTETGVDLRAPSALWRDDGGLRVWFTRQVAGGGAPAIWLAELPSASDLPDVAPAVALVADAAWEQGAVQAPTVARDPGSPGRLVMYYQGGVDAPAIGRAVSDDDGETWRKDPAPVLLGATAPTAALTPSGWLVAAERPDVEPPSIWLARGEPLVFDAAPVIMARGDRPEAFDRDAVGQPTLVSRGAGAPLGLWFVGSAIATDARADAVGYAGSSDGLVWTRLPGDEPMLRAQASDPAVLLAPDHALMLYVDTYRNRFAIGVARHP